MKQKTQKLCDKLCTPLVKKLHKCCLLCGGEVQVAHHYVHKSKSLALRYDEKNLIPLCISCHCKLHHDESFWGGKVRQIMGEEWFKYLEEKKRITTRYIDYTQIYEMLESMLAK